jgi:hypothetical protein
LGEINDAQLAGILRVAAPAPGTALQIDINGINININVIINNAIKDGIDKNSPELLGYLMYNIIRDSDNNLNNQLAGVAQNQINILKSIQKMVTHLFSINRDFEQTPSKIPDINIKSNALHIANTKPKKTKDGYIYRNKDGRGPNNRQNIRPKIGYITTTYEMNVNDSNIGQLIGQVGSASLISPHFRQLKYNTIIMILSKIRWVPAPALVLGPANGDNYFYENSSLMKKLHKFVNSMNVKEEKKTTYALMIIGKLIDSILNNFMNNAITGFSNKFILDLLKTTDLKFNKDNLIFKEDEQFKLNFKEIFKQTIDYFQKKIHDQNQDIDYEKLFKSTVVIKDQDELDHNQNKLSKFDHYIFSINYHSGNTTFEKMCFKIEMDVLESLINNFSSINHQDSVGNTPLHYAINIQHKEAIELLIKNGAKIIGVKNESNQTPLDYAIDLLKMHNKTLLEKDDLPNLLYENLCKSYTTSIEDFIDEKGKYKNNYIQYLENVMPMLIIMYNQYLFSRAKNYHKEWTYEDHQQLIKLFNDYGMKTPNNYHKKCNFIEFNTDEIKELMKSSKNIHVLKYQLKRNNKEKNKYDDKKNMLQKQIDNIQKDIDNLNGGDASDNVYIDELKQQIVDLQGEIRSIDAEISDLYVDNMETNLDNRVDILANDFSQSVANFKNGAMKRFNKPIYQFYEEVFDNVTNMNNRNNNKDWRIYNQMWDNYIKSDKKLKNIENTHLSIILIIQQIINRLRDKTKINDIYNDISVLNKFYKNICVDIIEGLNTLPFELDIQKNFPLYEFVNMAKHILHHVVTRSFFYIIVKLIYKYVKNRTIVPNDQNKGDYINDIVQKILEDDSNGESLIDLLNAPNYKWEEQIIKVTLVLYNGDYDEDKEIKDIDDMFIKITNILLNNKLIPIVEDSEMITYLKDYLYTYYKDAMYIKTIHQMHQLFDSYNRYILNEARYLDIIEILLAEIKPSNDKNRDIQVLSI